MFIRDWWSTRTPGTGRLILLVAVFVPLTVFLLRPFIDGLRPSPPPSPVAAEFRLVSIDGKPPSRIACRSRRPGGRIVLGTNGEWWMQIIDCRLRYGLMVQSGDAYRRSGDTLTLAWIHPHRGELVRHVMVQRGDSLDLAGTFERKKSVSRFVRVRTPAP